jgi:N-acetylmuramoyl-L-alanine amidase
MKLNRAIPILLVLFFSTFLHEPLLAQDNDITVTAEKGEGIYGILRRHGLDPSTYLRQFIEMNKSNLGKDNALLEGKSYILPATPTIVVPVSANAGIDEAEKAAKPTKLIRPLLGKKYEEITLRDNVLEGAVYYLISGHGGPDPGAMAKYGDYYISEDEYAYDVTLRLYRRLLEHGATAYMIIRDENDGIRDDVILELDTDEVCYPNDPIPVSQKDRLKQQTDAVNKLHSKHAGAYQRLIVIHIDSRKVGQNIDVFFYHHHRSKSGERLARHIQDTFRRKYAQHQPNRNYTGTVTDRSGLYVIKNTLPPTVFMELGNIKSAGDQRRFVISSNRQAMANWIAEGIIADWLENKGNELNTKK